MGLRLNEALSLQVGDIDAARGFAHIHRGKGAKDRLLPLPPSTLKLLRSYWCTHRHPSLLFPGNRRGHSLAKHEISTAKNPMSETTVQEAISKITGTMNLGKKVTHRKRNH
ncbi:site-specific tyrosine recombinase XerC [Rubripirellula lacrimiformis]|uniref:Site-specific tyrosine recombinase XerC n=1 Tax=Rubripirellula lacrimiformis TaxID=1930273 RepID=A0A517N7D7_9BACT|nr:tyrosine-type recombinase/integrase [Rubripirellula lacrimiformis]QDT03045.1 site-specific tyrosine recombinase XerC [Rubripirellula lacrimiformis]